MLVSSELGQSQRILEAGFDYMTRSGVGFQLRYERTSADAFSSKQAALKFTYPF